MCGSPMGESFEEMKRHFESQRDKEYISHVCAQHPRNARPVKVGGVVQELWSGNAQALLSHVEPVTYIL